MFVAPYFALVREDAPQRQYSLRAVLNALCYLVKTGCGWRDSRCFEHLMADLCESARLLAGREADLAAVILDSRMVQKHA